MNIQAVLQPDHTTHDILQRMRETDLGPTSPMLRDQLVRGLHDRQSVH